MNPYNPRTGSSHIRMLEQYVAAAAQTPREKDAITKNVVYLFEMLNSDQIRDRSDIERHGLAESYTNVLKVMRSYLTSTGDVENDENDAEALWILDELIQFVQDSRAL